MHLRDNIVIRNSLIHGRGVFATRRIQQGEITVDWTQCSDVLSDEQVLALPVVLREQEASLTFDSMSTMDEQIMTSLGRPKSYALLIGGFALFAIAILRASASLACCPT
jgi:hypothetical protein